MAKLLYVEASPRKGRSHSIEISQVFLESYKEACPTDEIETLDLWERDLPPFDGETIDAKYAVMHGMDQTPEQAAAWKRIREVCDQFKSATKYLFSLPMWNFGIPYKLKHYIDVITQPGLTFSFSPDTGYRGLVTGKTASVVYARGGEYTKDAGTDGMDFQKPYFEMWLRFIGFADIRPVVIEPTLQEKEKVDLVKAFVKDHIQKIAREV